MASLDLVKPQSLDERCSTQFPTKQGFEVDIGEQWEKGTFKSSASCSAEEQGPNKIIANYLLARVAEFRDLKAVRERGWNNPDADKAFGKQRQKADAANAVAAKRLYQMMKRNGRELDLKTSGFLNSRASTAEEPPSIVDFCMAPGGFLSIALRKNAGSRALAFTLPASDGGHMVLLPSTENVQVRCIDITMLAADMGVTNVPKDHEEADNFLPRAFTQDKRMFDLAICDGQVLRTHARASYREAREASRLTITQLALGLGNLKEGGTMIVLLHKVEAWRTVRLLHQFSKFSNVRLFKPLKAHTTRSSCYMVASQVRPLHIEAVRAT